MKTAILIFSSLFISVLFSCSSDSKPAINKVVDTFFKNYKSDYRKVDHSLLSKELSDLIDKAVAREILEEEKVKNSDFPTDKPLMIEGDVFTSLYEGQDSYKIENITIEDKKATVTVEFANSEFKVTWKDEVVLVNENGWKIDDVLYTGNKVDVKGAKDALSSLIHYQ